MPDIVKKEKHFLIYLILVVPIRSYVYILSGGGYNQLYKKKDENDPSNIFFYLNNSKNDVAHW